MGRYPRRKVKPDRFSSSIRAGPRRLPTHLAAEPAGDHRCGGMVAIHGSLARLRICLRGCGGTQLPSALPRSTSRRSRRSGSSPGRPRRLALPAGMLGRRRCRPGLGVALVAGARARRCAAIARLPSSAPSSTIWVVGSPSAGGAIPWSSTQPGFMPTGRGSFATPLASPIAWRTFKRPAAGSSRRRGLLAQKRSR